LGFEDESHVIWLVTIKVFEQNKRDVTELVEALFDASRKLGDSKRVNGGVTVQRDKFIYVYTVDKISGLLVFTASVKSKEENPLSGTDGATKFFDIIEDFSKQYGLESLSSFKISIYPKEEDQILVKRLKSTPRAGIGVGRSDYCYMIISDPEVSKEISFNRQISILPIRGVEEEQIETTLEYLKQMATSISKLSKIFTSRTTVFSVIESGEEEISRKVEEILWALLQPEPVEYAKLESWLSYTLERGSTTMAILSSLQSSHVEAKEAYSELQHHLSQLNTTRVGVYPTIEEWENQRSSKTLWKFEKTITSTIGLDQRLEALMEKIRVYLSLQQHRLSLEEQKASREEITRLVKLQEALHKLEVIIVAVYILEMARILFEAFAHEHANVLSVVFMPVALLLSMFINRILSKEN